MKLRKNNEIDLKIFQSNFLLSPSLKLNHVGVVSIWPSWQDYPKTTSSTVKNYLRMKLKTNDEIEEKKKFHPDSLLSPGLKLNHVRVVLTWFSKVLRPGPVQGSGSGFWPGYRVWPGRPGRTGSAGSIL